MFKNTKKSLLSLIVMLLLFPLSISNVSALYVNGEKIDWNKRMTNGKSINYYLYPGVEYGPGISAAAQKLMYPSGMSNNMVLNRTYTNSASKMDFKQERNAAASWAAKTSSHRKNSSGNYYAMPVVEKDSYDWVYATITINDAHFYSSSGSQLMSNEKIQAIIIHEMLHGYGLKDLYQNANYKSIMFGYTYGTATGVTSDANTVLNTKYP